MASAKEVKKKIRTTANTRKITSTPLSGAPEPVPAAQAGTVRPADHSPPAATAAPPLPGPARTPATRPAFRLRFLGLPEVHRRISGDAREEDWERVSFSLRRGLRVLAYLATSPERRAARDELEEAVWPEADSEAIERNFGRR